MPSCHAQRSLGFGAGPDDGGGPPDCRITRAVRERHAQELPRVGAPEGVDHDAHLITGVSVCLLQPRRASSWTHALDAPARLAVGARTSIQIQLCGLVHWKSRIVPCSVTVLDRSNMA